ncbi:MAG: hypothetical protein LDLANPLL_01552 [Turneriella sp.]|nr:hypothetical protein [Turneriella sp.]
MIYPVPQKFLKGAFAIVISFLSFACARLGTSTATMSDADALASLLVTPTTTKPGMGPDGGPSTWSFWAKNRQASADALLGSFTPFYRVNAVRRATSQHFVLYADAASSVLVSSNISRTGTLTAGSTTVAGLSTTADLSVNMRVTGGGLPCTTHISSIVDANTVVITNAAPANATPTLTFARGPSAILDTLECAYPNLLNTYGAGEHPYANNNARIVILAYDILDDFDTTNNYVGGFFAPRDLYSNQFTTSLFTNPVAIQRYPNLIGQLGGYSNEMSIVYYDLNPGYTTAPNQVNGIVIHELSHLFTYNYRVVKQRLNNPDLWIAEGIAENAPHQTNGATELEALRLVQTGSPGMFSNYQKAPQLTDFQTWGPKIVGYLQSNLFFNYLRHRLELQTPGSAANFIRAVVTHNGNSSLDTIDTLIQSYIPGANFSSIYADFTITHYLMLLGIPIADTNGIDNTGTGLEQKYSFCNVEIGSSNTSDNRCASTKVRYPNAIPFNFDAPSCGDGTFGLKPNSYIVIRHRVAGDETHFNVAGTNPIVGELPLKLVVNTTTEDTFISSPPAQVYLHTYDAGTTIPFTTTLGLANGDIVHIVVHNPNKTGSCRKFDPNWILKRNHSKWVGKNTAGIQPSPDFDWQSGVGAPWVTDTDGTYYRPAGIAAFTSGYPNNFLYVTDFVNMSLQKLDLDKGTPLGRLGNASNLCPTSGSGWNQSANRYVNGYCAHNFNYPQGVHVDRDHNIYVADADNSRIVRYSAAGTFTGWLGLDTDDTWQTGNFKSGGDLVAAGAENDPRMFRTPYSIATDPDDPSATYLYTVDYSSKRISRRNRLTGSYAGFIGNGKNAWDTTTLSQTPSYGFSAGYFGNGSIGPRGLQIKNGKMYVADEGNQRVVRIDVATGNFEGWLGDGHDDWQPMATPPSQTLSSNVKYFRYPSDVATDGKYLFIADRENNRIVKWRIDGANCDKPVTAGKFCGWIGHGRVGWETTAPAPASDPYQGVSYYPPDYYAQPHALALVNSIQKGTRNNYLFMTSVYNGRVSRINLSCVDNPSGPDCDSIYPFP